MERVKRDRQARCGGDQPGKAAKDVLGLVAERAVFELDVDGVELG